MPIPLLHRYQVVSTQIRQVPKYVLSHFIYKVQMCVRSFKTTKVYFAMKQSCVKIWIASQGIYTNSVFPVSASTHHERGGDVFWMQSQQELIHWEWNNIFSNSRTMMRPKNSNLSVPAIPVTNKILNGKAMCWVFCVCSEESSLRMLHCQKYQLY